MPACATLVKEKLIDSTTLSIKKKKSKYKDLFKWRKEKRSEWKGRREDGKRGQGNKVCSLGEICVLVTVSLTWKAHWPLRLMLSMSHCRWGISIFSRHTNVFIMITYCICVQALLNQYMHPHTPSHTLKHADMLVNHGSETKVLS